MQQMAIVVERNWLDSWPRTMQEEAGYQTDTVEAYEMMTGMSEDETKELNS